MPAIDPDFLAEALGIGASEQEILDTANEHQCSCRCSVCREYWKLVGPDEGPDGEPVWGPFSIGEMGLTAKEAEYYRKVYSDTPR